MIRDKIIQGRAIAQSQAQDQSRSIPYRPQYNKITKSVTAAVLLQQINYWWHKQHCKPFYKFKAPCIHEKYREGDSWTEELGIGTTAFNNALKSIGAAKITKGTSKTELLKNHLVIYWTDRNRMTWYQLNEDMFNYAIYLAYCEPKLLCNGWVITYLDELQPITYIPT